MSIAVGIFAALAVVAIHQRQRYLAFLMLATIAVIITLGVLP